MNIDLLCGHATMLHCGCKVCARNAALEEAAKILDEDCEKLAAHGADAPALQSNIQAMKIRALKNGKEGR